MAFLKIYETGNFDVVIKKIVDTVTPQKYYIKINNVNMVFVKNEPFWNINFGIYMSKEARDANTVPLSSLCYNMPVQELLPDTDIRHIIYEYCKTLSEFLGVEDI